MANLNTFIQIGANTGNFVGTVTGTNIYTSGVVSAAGNIRGGNINTAGNVAGAYIVGNGSQLTNLPTSAPVVESITSSATITPSSADTQYNVTALAVTANVAAPSGTPLDGQKLTIRITDNGNSQTLSWDAIYRVIGTTLPTATVANKDVYIGCIYNNQRTTWDVVSVAQQS